MPPEELEEFLESDGGIGLLVVLSEGGRRYSELEEELMISRGTIEKRRDEARELGMLEERPIRGENRTTTLYTLTREGRLLVRLLSRSGIVRHYKNMRDNQRHLEADLRNLDKWDENDSIIDWADRTIRSEDVDEFFDDLKRLDDKTNSNR